MNDSSLPAIRTQPWSAAAIRLLQGAVYNDDDDVWGVVLRYQSSLADYLSRIGLQLVVDEYEGLAYLRQVPAEHLAESASDLPRLFRRTRLSYEATLLCVLLRERLRQFEEEDVDNARCVVPRDELLTQWKLFFPAQEDEVKLARSLDSAFRKLEKLRFVSRFGRGGDAWEVRRILKARLSVEELEGLRQQLQQHVHTPSSPARVSD
ncbi:MAG: DUF4194 domain-containing protein [Planctomycetota bacterium]|nr:MAG: DUF4194 domain-containing protein [Planctomycetota bacterium]